MRDTALDAKDRPVLYSFRRCPYAMRARMAIAASGIDVDWREVVLKDKPAHMVAISPKATVPVVQLADGRVIEESLDVMMWALGESDPHGWLPKDDAAEEARTLVYEADWTFKYHLDRYKYPNRYDGAVAEDHREAALCSLIKWDARLSTSQNLLGDQATYVDYAIFPFVRQFANVDRAWFDAVPLPHLHRWLEAHLASDTFQMIMEKEAAWKPGDPVKKLPVKT